MSGSGSLTLEQSILDHTLGITPMPTVTRAYVALCLVSPPPSETSAGTEVAGGGYARQAATFERLTTPANAASNNATIEFPLAAASWGTVGWFEIWTQQIGGTRLYWGELVDPADGTTPITLSVSAGDIVRFSAGTLAVQITSLATLGGQYLPLSGGTVSGSVGIGADRPNYITIAGGATNSPAVISTVGGANADLAIYPQYNGSLFVGINQNYPRPNASFASFNYGAGGAVASGQMPVFESHSIGTDTVDASQAVGSGLSWYTMNGSLNAGAVGGRTVFGADFNQNGATNSAGQYYVSGSFYSRASHSAGGAAGATKGLLFASNDASLLLAGAGIYWQAVVGYELDIGAETGVGVAYKQGMKVVNWVTDRVAGSQGQDFAYGMAAQSTCAGWDVGYSVGAPDGWWPMKSTSTLIGTLPPFAGSPAYTAAWGVDFTAVTFSGGLIRGPGFSVDASGKAHPSGVALALATVSTPTDVTKHIDLYNTQAGISVSGSTDINYVGFTNHQFYAGATLCGTINPSGITASAGHHCGSQTVTARTDLTKHLDLYGGTYGINVMSSGNMSVEVPAAASTEFSCGTTFIGSVSPTGLNYMAIGATSAAVGNFTQVAVGGATGPTWTTGSAAPAATAPVGSLYSRVGGAVGATLYVSRGAGTWAAVAGV